MVAELDMISVVVGYFGGVFLTWSICRTIYDSDVESSDGFRSESDIRGYGIYGWNNSRDE